MKKKIIALLLVVALTAAVAVGGTLAYLTDRDSEANVFTVGDVNIDLNESFNQGDTLIPGVDIAKKPTITNVGPNEAYVWATVAVPANLAPVVDFTGRGTGWEAMDSTTSTTINNEDYVLYTILHTNALEVGGVTNALFSNVALSSSVDVDPDGNWHTVVDGVATDLGWSNADGNPVIHVSAYAIQTDGFNSVAEAYAAYNTQWGANGTAYGGQATLVGTADELAAVLTNGGLVVLTDNIQGSFEIPADKEVTLNLNGKTITYAGTPTGGNPPVALINNGKLVIEGNGTISAEYAGFYNTGSVEINGGTFESANGFGMITDNIYGTETATTIINGGTFDGIGVYNPTHLTINNAVINVGRDPDGASDHLSSQMALFISPTFTSADNIATVILNGGNVNGDVYVYDDGITTTTFENKGATITGSILDNG